MANFTRYTSAIGMSLALAFGAVAEETKIEKNCDTYNTIVNNLGNAELARGGQSLQSFGCIRKKSYKEDYGLDKTHTTGLPDTIFSELPCDAATLSEPGVPTYLTSHSFQMFANIDSGDWTLLNVFKATTYSQYGEYTITKACHIAQGSIYFNQGDGAPKDKSGLSLQSIMALRANDDENNEGYSVFLDEQTGNWEIRRQTSGTDAEPEVFMSGDNYEEINSVASGMVWEI